MSGQIARAKILAAHLILRVPSLKKVIDRAGRSGSPIFAFHRVLPEVGDGYHREMITTPGVFAAFLDWISDHYQPVPLADMIRLRHNHTHGGKPYCALTFDDGWRDNFLHAFPILRERRFPATVFLSVRFIGTRRRFWQERLWFGLRSFGSAEELREAAERVVRSLPWCRRLTPDQLTFDDLRRRLLDRPSAEAEEFVDRLSELAGGSGESDAPAFLGWDEVRVMQEGGVTFGSHTLNHTLLSRAGPVTAWREIEGSRQELAERLGSPPQSIAYPWGATGPFTLAQVKAAGYEVGVTTEGRLFDDSFDRLLLPRLLISDSSVCGTGQDFHAGKSRLMIARSALGLMNGNARPPGKRKYHGQRLRIGFVIDSIDSWEDGGTERQIAQLLGALDRRYFNPELYFLRPSLHLKAGDFPCPVHIAGSRPEVKWYRPEAFMRLIRLFREHRPQIVQTFFRDATYYGILAAKIARVPVTIVSVRNAGYWRRYRDRLPLMVINRLAGHWQCNSRSVSAALELGDRIREERIEVLPNAIDLSRFAPASPSERLAARQRLGLPTDVPVFISVANLQPVKDLSTLIAAAALVRRELPTARFLLVGEGPVRQTLESQAARLNLGDCVLFPGTVADVRPYLAAADIGLLTSRSEASSNSVLEYMAMRLPVVASDIPGNRDLVNEVFFTAGDSEDLAVKISALWNDQERRERLGEGNCRGASKYSCTAFERRAQSYYDKLIAESPSAGWQVTGVDPAEIVHEQS
jgi:glycosyltransferase involved in cell wall biosynthesis/peptidoglycan/xylan/chitin deacetylase (PgdA/CDA1 family)